MYREVFHTPDYGRIDDIMILQPRMKNRAPHVCHCGPKAVIAAPDQARGSSTRNPVDPTVIAAPDQVRGSSTHNPVDPTVIAGLTRNPWIPDQVRGDNFRVRDNNF